MNNVLALLSNVKTQVKEQLELTSVNSVLTLLPNA